jgi:hypothetical protein
MTIETHDSITRIRPVKPKPIPKPIHPRTPIPRRKRSKSSVEQMLSFSSSPSVWVEVKSEDDVDKSEPRVNQSSAGTTRSLKKHGRWCRFKRLLFGKNA